MSRYGFKVESQAAQPAGVPSGVTFNGYFMAIVGGTASDFRLRELKIGIRAGASVPTSQQVTIGVYRQTVRAVGTGFSTVVGQNLDPNGPASAITGVDITTGAAAGTTGPTIGANPIDGFTFNDQQGLDFTWELLSELWSALGTANALAFVNIGNALPASHLYVVGGTWEE